MKNNSDRPEREYNPPAVMAARAIFLLFGLAAPAAALLLLGGALAHDTRRLLLGALFGLLAVGLHGWLSRRGWLAGLLADLGEMDDPPMPGGDVDFARLVRAWDDLSDKRGTPSFDPWQLLSLRREIEARTRDNPVLADYWRDHRG